MKDMKVIATFADGSTHNLTLTNLINGRPSLMFEEIEIATDTGTPQYIAGSHAFDPVETIENLDFIVTARHGYAFTMTSDPTEKQFHRFINCYVLPDRKSIYFQYCHLNP
jgi:hypothetical protein